LAALIALPKQLQLTHALLLPLLPPMLPLLMLPTTGFVWV
jgi:hypothetical protein